MLSRLGTAANTHTPAANDRVDIFFNVTSLMTPSRHLELGRVGYQLRIRPFCESPPRIRHVLALISILLPRKYAARPFRQDLVLVAVDRVPMAWKDLRTKMKRSG